MCQGQEVEALGATPSQHRAWPLAPGPTELSSEGKYVNASHLLLSRGHLFPASCSGRKSKCEDLCSLRPSSVCAPNRYAMCDGGFLLFFFFFRATPVT